MGLITEMSVAHTLNLFLNKKIGSCIGKWEQLNIKLVKFRICLYNPNSFERSFQFLLACLIYPKFLELVNRSCFDNYWNLIDAYDKKS